ncbi:MAG: SBBP repeat-containing protein, partial [Gammaproteobacteria bacterium]
SGNAYVAGATLSDDFPTTAVSPSFNIGITQTCYDPSNPGASIPCSDAYVAKYDSSGVKQYATFLGGYYEDAATAIAVKSSTGDAYVTGVTHSPTFNTKNGFQQIFGGGVGDAFVVKLGSAGGVAYGTYLGGDGWDQGQSIALDGAEDIYVVGATNSSSSTLPLSNSLQAIYGGGGYDAFAAKLKPNTSTSGYDIQYFTYLGGSDRDLAFGVAGDSSGNAYVVGETMSPDFQIDTAIQSNWFGGGNNKWGDAFITKISTSGLLAWSTYLGGGDDDWANGVALDGSGGIYVVGSSFSSDFPTENPYQAASAGNGEAVLFKLADSPVTADLQLGVSATPDPVGAGETLTYQMVVNNLSASNDAGGVVIMATLPGGISFKSATPAGSCSASGAQVTCNVGAVAAGSSVTTSLETVSNTAGDISFTAKIVRANQPDPDSSNNSADITTKAAVGSSGGGALSLGTWLVSMIAYWLRRRSGTRLQSL